MVVWSASQLAATEAVPACATAGAMQIAKTSMPIEFFMLLSQLSFEKVADNKAYGESSSTPFIAVEPGISWIILESITAHTGMSNFGEPGRRARVYSNWTLKFSYISGRL